MHRPYIRPLGEADWSALRDLRLHALRSEPGVYFSTLQAEFAHSEVQWRALAANFDDRQRVFGLFEAEVLIGISAVFTYRDDPTGRTALLGMTYLRPEYRGQGLAQLFFEARLAWIRSVPRFTRVRVSHRRSNEPSRRAIVRHGFVCVDRATRVWPDGLEDEEPIYELVLEPLVVVRPRTADDMPECVAILRDVHERDDYPSLWPDDPAAWLSPKRLLSAWVATSGASITGHVVVGTFGDERESVPRPAGEVQRLFVSSSARHGGTGAALLSRAVDECRAAGLQPVLRVRDEQHAAIALYERTGWEQVDSYRASWQTPLGETPLILVYTYKDSDR